MPGHGTHATLYRPAGQEGPAVTTEAPHATPQGAAGAPPAMLRFRAGGARYNDKEACACHHGRQPSPEYVRQVAGGLVYGGLAHGALLCTKYKTIEGAPELPERFQGIPLPPLCRSHGSTQFHRRRPPGRHDCPGAGRGPDPLASRRIISRYPCTDAAGPHGATGPGVKMCGRIRQAPAGMQPLYAWRHGSPGPPGAWGDPACDGPDGRHATGRRPKHET